jgi:hypothetical protein
LRRAACACWRPVARAACACWRRCAALPFTPPLAFTYTHAHTHARNPHITDVYFVSSPFYRPQYIHTSMLLARTDCCAFFFLLSCCTFFPAFTISSTQFETSNVGVIAHTNKKSWLNTIASALFSHLMPCLTFVQ